MKKSPSSGQSKLRQSSQPTVGKGAPSVAPGATKLPLRPENEGRGAVALRDSRSPSAEPRSVEFSYTNPTASAVSLVGDFNDWQPGATPMRKQRGGKWIAALQLKRGEYEYRFMVDGEWCEDPAASRSVANPFGGLNSIKVVELPSPSEMQA